MTTSDTYAFAPGLGELTLYAFNLAGIRNASLTQQHMETARMAAGMVLARWSGEKGVNLWTVDLETVPLVQGQATYPVPVNTIAILDAYQTQAGRNRLVLPVSRSEYASYPNPTQEGAVTVFWFDRLLSPTLTLYQVPDGTATSLSYYRMRQIQDAPLTGNLQPELPIYYLEAFAYALAQRLAVIWAPDRATGLKGLADEAYGIASTQGTETSAFYVSPMVGGYWRA